MDHLEDETRRKLEKDYVNNTYESIAEDFSATRYKKWPKVDKFLQSLERNSLMLDVGCGNGKYLDNEHTYNIGCDASYNLMKICKNRNFEVVQCDMSRLPFRAEVFDVVICVAALHHVVKESRRRECLQKICELLSVGCKLFVQVWAFEQELEKNNPYLKNRASTEVSNDSIKIPVDESTGIQVHINRTPFKEQDLLIPFKIGRGRDPIEQQVQHLRYYHLFRKDELESLTENMVPRLEVLQSYYDCGNWCVIFRRNA